MYKPCDGVTKKGGKMIVKLRLSEVSWRKLREFLHSKDNDVPDPVIEDGWKHAWILPLGLDHKLATLMEDVRVKDSERGSVYLVTLEVHVVFELFRQGGPPNKGVYNCWYRVPEDYLLKLFRVIGIFTPGGTDFNPENPRNSNTPQRDA